MADFAPLISRAIAGLEKNTAENRRVLYDRARSALVAQLRSIDPPLSESEITRERLGLEEAIRRIESEIARGQRETSQREGSQRQPPAGAERPAPRPAPRPAETPPANAPAAPPAPGARSGPDSEAPPSPPPAPERRPGSFQARIDRLTTGEGKQRLRAGLRDEKTLLEEKQGAATAAEATGPAPPAKAPDAAAPDVAAQAGIAQAGAVQPGDAKAGGAKADEAEANSDAKAASEAPPPPVPAAEAAALPPAPPSGAPGEAPERAPPPTRPAKPPIGPLPATASLTGPATTERRAKIEPRPAPRPPASRPRYDEVEMADEAAGGRARFWTIIVGLLVLVMLAAAVGLLAASGRLPWSGADAPPHSEAPLPQSNERPKISDRVSQDTPRPPAAQPQQQAPAAPPAQALQVAQRAILYEEDPAAGQQGQVLIGSVAWRTETMMPGAGLPPDLAIRGEVQIPDRRMSATVTIRRNVDAALPASHTIELLFTTPPDFPFGGVAKVPGILAKRGEGQRGAPLAGLAVDVTAGFFIVGLSAIEADVQRNLQLLKERAWLDIPVVYKNGRRAILSVEKGIPGDRVFAEAFAAWGQ